MGSITLKIIADIIYLYNGESDNIFFNQCYPNRTFAIEEQVNPFLKVLKNGQTNFKNLAVLTTQDIKCMFDYFLTLQMKGFIPKFFGCTYYQQL